LHAILLTVGRNSDSIVSWMKFVINWKPWTASLIFTWNTKPLWKII
jgi:Transposase IS116/IS110/IS902 family.